MRKLQLKQTEKALDRFAQKVVARAKSNLAKRKDGRKGPANTKNKTLSKSLGYYLKVYPSGAVELQFGAADHWKYVEYGRRKGAKQPPPSVLKNWIKIKPLRLRDLSSGKFIEKNDRNISSAAYLIGRKIKEKGIKPRFFFRDAFNMHYKRLPQEVISMYASDVAKFLRATTSTL